MNLELQMPRPRNLEGVEVVSLSAEHGVLRIAEGGPDLKIGQRLELIPGYGDFTTVLHDRFFAFRQGRLEAIWPLAARGRLQ
jgi:3-hydroxy-D-aspartate aldolase